MDLDSCLIERCSCRYFAQRTLRIERMYPSWGQDIDKKTTPFHLNREYHVSFDVRNLSFDVHSIGNENVLEKFYWKRRTGQTAERRFTETICAVSSRRS